MKKYGQLCILLLKIYANEKYTFRRGYCNYNTITWIVSMTTILSQNAEAANCHLNDGSQGCPGLDGYNHNRAIGCHDTGSGGSDIGWTSEQRSHIV